MPTQCAVSGNLQTLTGGALRQGLIIFQLTNTGSGNPIGISGTSIIPQLTYTVQSAGDGSFSVSLWGNDNINPTNTLYSVTYRDVLGNEMGPILYSITGNTFNLNSASASSTIPPTFFNIGGNIQSINGILNAALFPGIDYGAKINAAYAALPSTGGIIIIPSGTQVNITTPVLCNVANKPVLIEGAPGSAVYLGWPSLTGTMFTFDTRSGSNQHPIGQGVRNLYLQTSGASTATAINFGNINSGEGSIVEYCTIVGFGIGINLTGGSNTAFNISSIGTNYVSCGICINVGPASTGCENTRIVGGLFVAATTSCINISGASNSSDVYVFGASFDDAPSIGTFINLNGAAGAAVTLIAPHFENPSGGSPNYSTIAAGTLTLHGGVMDDDVSSGTLSTPWITMTGGNLNLKGTNFHSNGRTTNVPIISQSGSAKIDADAFSDTPSLFTGSLPLFAAASVTAGTADGSFTGTSTLGARYFALGGAGLGPVGAVLGDWWSSRSATTGAHYFGSDGNSYLFRNGNNLLINVPSSGLIVCDTNGSTGANVSGAILTEQNSGNTVTLLNAQGTSGAITGTGAAAVVFTYSLLANTVATLKGIRVTASILHSTGTASVAYLLQLNGQTISSLTSAATTEILFETKCLNLTSTTGFASGYTAITSGGNTAFSSSAVPSLAWTSNQTLQLTFNVANTDAVTPHAWMVELIQ